MKPAVLIDGSGRVDPESGADVDQAGAPTLRGTVRQAIEIPSEVMETFMRQLAVVAHRPTGPSCSCCGSPALTDSDLFELANTNKGSFPT